MIAAVRPLCIAIVKKLELTISRCGNPKEIFETPRIVLQPSSWRTRRTVSSVTSAPVGSELIVIQSASITMSFFWMPYFSASAQIFRAIAIRPSAVAGMPSSSIVSATTVPP